MALSKVKEGRVAIPCGNNLVKFSIVINFSTPDNWDEGWETSNSWSQGWRPEKTWDAWPQSNPEDWNPLADIGKVMKWAVRKVADCVGWVFDETF